MKYNLKQLDKDYKLLQDRYVNRILFLLPFLFFTVCNIQAQPVGTKNLGFENGNFNGWKGYAWRESDSSPKINSSPGLVSIPTSRRHVIISDQSAYDPNTNNALKMIPEGYTFSARLGDEMNSSDSKPRCWVQTLQYTMTVDSSNVFLLMKFACVLQFDGDHRADQEPRFRLTLYDQHKDKIPDCANYDVYSSASIDGFQSYTPPGAKDPVKWRDWTTVGADLTKYMGQEITIEFMAADCRGRSHFGYTYFVVDCMPLYITVDYCTGDSRAILEAPIGFKNYKWLDTDSTTVIGTEQDLILSNPQEGMKYYIIMESETGCEVILSAKVEKYEPHADFSWRMVDCFSNEVEFTNNSTTNKGDLSYLWLLEDDTTVSEKSFTHKFNTSGLHEVGLIIYNPPSGCTDTIFKTIESFSPPLVGFQGDTTYCPDMEAELIAYGAFSYEWSTGDTTEIISLGAPGGNYWFLGYSTPEEGCVSDTLHFVISEEPDWPFSLLGDVVLCEGDTNTITALGAFSYQWNTGDSSDSIVISEGGTYRVTGANKRGCIKELELDVQKVQNPVFDFSLSPNTVNRRHNRVSCSAQSVDDLGYEWEMGDGLKRSSPEFDYNYSVGSDLISYPIVITATNQSGCFTTKFATVLVEPFVPNVFTPNSDGVNDVFMAGYKLKIFDRHGIVMFSGNDGWDGYYKGKQVDPDTYFYQFKYTDAKDQEQLKKGFITVVR